jgi:Xaa-Pro aminopeptidase
MALIKKTLELEAIRKSCQIASQLHTQSLMMKETIGVSESEFAAKLTRNYDQTEAEDWAYPLIVGSGRRATILHAKPTQKKIREDELVLIDMGVKYGGMCSDITRTWPAGSRFTKEQKTIYEIVLRAQKEVIKRVKPGQNLQDLHQVAKDYLLDGLLSKSVMKKKQLGDLYPHKTSHWIGEVVHDCSNEYFYKDETPMKLAAGMCFTVEPGLYFTSKNSRFGGIGVRIEDVILVTETGYEVITHVPKEVEEIEALRNLK